MLVLFQSKIYFYDTTTFTKIDEILLNGTGVHIDLSWDDKLLSINYRDQSIMGKIYNL